MMDLTFFTVCLLFLVSLISATTLPPEQTTTGTNGTKTAESQVDDLIVAMDLNRLIIVLSNSNNSKRIPELVSRIVQGIDLTTFGEVDRLFQFSLQLPNSVQLSLIREVLSKMRSQTQYQHLFHVILQVKFLKKSVRESTEKSLLSTVESEIPSVFRSLVSDDTKWQIKRFNSDEYIFISHSPKYYRYILLLDSYKYIDWQFRGESSNSTSAFQQIYEIFTYNNYYLSIDYDFHNGSFPIAKKSYSKSDVIPNNWYLLMSNDLSYVQIKNIHTNELLIADNVQDTGNDQCDYYRVALSGDCSDCDTSKWLLEKH